MKLSGFLFLNSNFINGLFPKDKKVDKDDNRDIPKLDLNALEEFSFIAGTEYTIEYMVYQADGINPLDISSTTTKIYICPYGQPNYVFLTKAGVVSGVTTGLFTVTLTSVNTSSMSGKYIHQPVIADSADTEFRLAQGLFTVLTKII